MNLAITTYVDKRDWRTYNRMLVERGRTSTYVKTALANYEADLPQMNTSKVGAPYLYTDMLVIAGYAVKIIFKLGYRGPAGRPVRELHSWSGGERDKIPGPGYDCLREGHVIHLASLEGQISFRTHSRQYFLLAVQMSLPSAMKRLETFA